MPPLSKSLRPFWLKTTFIIIILVTAWMIGAARKATDLGPVYRSIYAGVDLFEPHGAVINAERDGQTLGLLATGHAIGYGGALHVIVAADTAGQVRRIEVYDHAETPAFYYRVSRHRRYRALRNKAITDPWTAGEDIDMVSGATYTSKAYIDASRMACQKLANAIHNHPIPEAPRVPWRFGWAEMVLILLFILGLLARGPWRRHAKALRWSSMLLGMTALGFILNQPLTLGWVSRLLMGQWPPLPTHLFNYLLISGIVVLTLAQGFNPYCDWFCPFGAAQECLGKMGGGRKRLPRKLHLTLRRLQTLGALSAVALALIWRNPTATSYEIFGAFFRLIGSTWQFAVLAVVLVASLFMRRPWCAYLCPLRPVTRALKALRKALHPAL